MVQMCVAAVDEVSPPNYQRVDRSDHPACMMSSSELCCPYVHSTTHIGIERIANSSQRDLKASEQIQMEIQKGRTTYRIGARAAIHYQM